MGGKKEEIIMKLKETHEIPSICEIFVKYESTESAHKTCSGSESTSLHLSLIRHCRAGQELFDDTLGKC